MKIGKFILASAASIALAGSALAGGILTNTNQSAAFLRHITRGVTLDADAPYYNPAGTAFMDDGWMLSLNAQSAFMTRTTTMDYAPFAMSAMTPGNGSQTFEGKIWSPVVPNLHATYKRNRWALFLWVRSSSSSPCSPQPYRRWVRLTDSRRRNTRWPVRSAV